MGFDPVDYLLAMQQAGKAGGGGGVTVEPLSVSENGVYNAPSGKAFSPVTVAVEADDTFAVANAMGTKITDIPDLSVLDRTDPVIYFIVDTAKYQSPLYSKFSVRPVGTGTLTMSVGHIASTGYMEDDSETVSSGDYYVKELTDNGHRFWAFRLTSAGGNVTRCDGSAAAYLDDPSMVPIVAIYGNVEYVTQFVPILYQTMVVDLTNVSSNNARGISLNIGNTLVQYKATGAFDAYVNLLYGATMLQYADLSGADLSASTDFAGVFYNCSQLKEVKLGTQSISAPVRINNLFSGCYSLASLDLSGLTFSSVTDTTNAFRQMFGLTDITGWTNIPISYSLNDSHGLTHDSLMAVINALPEVQTAQTLTLGSVNTAKLTAEEIAVATQKGWTVA